MWQQDGIEFNGWGQGFHCLFPDLARREDWRRIRSLFAPPSWSRRTRGSGSTSRSPGSSTPSSWSRETFSKRKWQSTRVPSQDDLLFQHRTMQFFSETLNPISLNLNTHSIIIWLYDQFNILYRNILVKLIIKVVPIKLLIMWPSELCQ